MALRIDLEGVDIQTINAPLYSGTVRVKIVPTGGTISDEVKMAIPFSKANGLGAGVTKALSDLRVYGNDLVQAVQDLTQKL